MWHPHFTLMGAGETQLYGPRVEGQVGGRDVPLRFLWGLSVMPFDQQIQLATDAQTLVGMTFAGNLGMDVLFMDLSPEAPSVQRVAGSIYALGLIGGSFLADYPLVNQDPETLGGFGAGVELGLNTAIRFKPTETFDLDVQLFAGALLDLYGYESLDTGDDLSALDPYIRVGTSLKFRWGPEPTPFTLSASVLLDEHAALDAWTMSIGLTFEDFPDVAPPPSLEAYYSKPFTTYLTWVAAISALPLLIYGAVQDDPVPAVVGIFMPATTYWIFQAIEP